MQQNLEHRLKQKLMLFENAVARLSSMKAELRANSDQVRRDLSSSVQHQISCLRARERELLGQLDEVVSEKEDDFSAQQDILSKAIGACQNSLDSLQDNSGSTQSINATLIKLNALNIKPRGNPNVSFEADPTDCRLAVSAFGTIFSEENNQLESLPMDMEMFEDDLHIHKSVMMSKMGSMNIKETASLVSDDSVSSSFEVVQNNDDATVKEEELPFFAEHINNISKSSNENWLRHDQPVSAASYQPLSPLFRPMSAQGSRYQFVDVIQNIQQSSKNNWLIAPNVDKLSNLANRLSLTASSDGKLCWLNNGETKWLQQPQPKQPNWLPKIGDQLPGKSYTDPALWLANQ